MQAILTIIVCSMSYALRGGFLQPSGFSNWIGRLLWFDTILLITNNFIIALGGFIGFSFISHGAYVKLAQIPVGSKETWLWPNDTFWRCFAALALIGYMRGILMWGLSWQACVLAIGYPLCCAVTSRMQGNWLGEMLSGGMVGALIYFN